MNISMHSKSKHEALVHWQQLPALKSLDVSSRAPDLGRTMASLVLHMGCAWLYLPWIVTSLPPQPAAALRRAFYLALGFMGQSAEATMTRHFGSLAVSLAGPDGGEEYSGSRQGGRSRARTPGRRRARRQGGSIYTHHTTSADDYEFYEVLKAVCRPSFLF